MKVLILLLAINTANATEIVTIDDSRYSFKVAQVTANIMQPTNEVIEESLELCIENMQTQAGMDYTNAYNTCIKDN